MAGIRRRTVIRAVLIVTLAVLIDPVGAVQSNSSPYDEDIEARIAQLTSQLDEARVRAAVAVEAYNGARAELADARDEESAALARLDTSRSHRDLADVEMGRLAAAAYRNGAGSVELSVVINTANDASIRDVTVAVSTVARSQARIHERWAVATDKANATAKAAAQLVTERMAAEIAAERALADARRAVVDHEQAIAQASATRDMLVAELAAARGTTAQLEQQRRQEIALQAQRDRDQAEAARANDADASDAEREPSDDAGQGEPLQNAEGGTAGAGDADGGAAGAEGETAGGAGDAAGGVAGADRVGGEPAVEPSQELAANPAGPSPAVVAAERAVDYAKAQLGKPYLWAGAGPTAFDCSGLTMRAWEQGGVQLTHWSVAQARQTVLISFGELSPGDLIFWSENDVPSGTYHVAIYIGRGEMIHAPSPGGHVEVRNVFYWRAPSFYARVTS